MEILEFREKIGRGLYITRRKLGLKQSDIADHFGVSVTAVSKWERGQVAMSADTFLELCEFLEVSPESLVGSAPDGLSFEEMELVEAFRRSSEDRQDAVRLLLGIEKKLSADMAG